MVEINENNTFSVPLGYFLRAIHFIIFNNVFIRTKLFGTLKVYAALCYTFMSVNKFNVVLKLYIQLLRY